MLAFLRAAASRKAAAWALIGALLGGLLGADPVRADLKLPPRSRGDPPMRIVLVTSADPACAPSCPQWISAEGRIMPGTAKAFATLVADLKGRRLPVLLSSRGGSVPDAVAMGLLIREKKLAVAVARTLIADCPARGAACPSETSGQAITGGAVCASACPLILAGGVARLAGPAALIGVHQITTIVREVEGSAGLTTVRKFYELNDADSEVTRYLTVMGVGDPVMALLRRTPAASIRWLSPDESRASGLATEALDALSPMLSLGANGLNGRTFAGAPAGVFTAQGMSAGLGASLAYRRGGGALELILSATASTAPPAAGWTVGLGEGASIPVPPSGHVMLPRARLCQAGQFSVTSAPEGAPKPVVFSLADMDGGQALRDEACP